MRNNKLITIGIFIFLVIIIVVVFTTAKNKNTKQVVPTVVPTPPTFSGQSKTNGSVLFSLVAGFNLPAVTDWQRYPLSVPNYKTQAEAIIRLVTEKSSQATTVSGEDEIITWSWQSGEASLSITSVTVGTFSFTDSSSEGLGITISSLPSALSLPTGMSIAPVTPATEVIESINFPYDPNLGKLFRSTFSYIYKGYPLLLSGPDERSLILFTDEKGRIRHASIVIPMKILAPTKELSAIKTSDVLYNLNQGRGLFATSDINGLWENDNPMSFSGVSIKQGRPARLLNTNSMTIEPVYILDGEGTSSLGSKTVRYILMGYSE